MYKVRGFELLLLTHASRQEEMLNIIVNRDFT